RARAHAGAYARAREGIAGFYGDFQAIGAAADGCFALVVVVMGEQISAEDHRPAVGVAAEDSQAAAGDAAVREFDEEAIAGEEEARAGQRPECGAQIARLDEGGGDEAQAVVRVEGEA